MDRKDLVKISSWVIDLLQEQIDIIDRIDRCLEEQETLLLHARIRGRWAEGQEGLIHSKEPDPRSPFGPMSIDSFPCPDIPSPSGTQARGNSTIFFIHQSPWVPRKLFPCPLRTPEREKWESQQHQKNQSRKIKRQKNQAD